MRESSETMLVSMLLIVGEVTSLGFVLIGLGSRTGCWSAAFRTDLRNASVDFIANASESLLSEGRRRPEDRETCDPFFDSMLGLLKGRLRLLSDRLISELVFLFSTTSPPAMTTGLIRSMRKGSCECVPARLSCEDMVPATPRANCPAPLLRLRTCPRRP
jgi:hypothetical protein